MEKLSYTRHPLDAASIFANTGLLGAQMNIVPFSVQGIYGQRGDPVDPALPGVECTAPSQRCPLLSMSYQEVKERPAG